MRIVLTDETVLFLEFEHKRGPVTVAAIVDEQGNPVPVERTYTVCSILDEKERVISTGRAIVHEGDPFAKSEGRKRALTNALAKAPFKPSRSAGLVETANAKILRAQIWNAYHAIDNKRMKLVNRLLRQVRRLGVTVTVEETF